MAKHTTIPIDPDTRDKLRGEKVGNETYSDVIERLIEANQDRTNSRVIDPNE